MKKETKEVYKYQDLLDEISSVVVKINTIPEIDREKFIFAAEDVLKPMHGRNGDTFDGFIFKTYDTTHFGDLEANRVINEDSVAVEELAQSISQYGNITPVIKNEKGDTIDGQRRIRAIRKFGLSQPLRYTTYRGANIDTVGEINRYHLKWNHKDWLHKYSILKNTHYIQYSELAKDYESVVKSRSLRSIFMYNRYESFPAKVWEKGEFKINLKRLPEMIRFLNLMKRVSAIGEQDNIFAKDRNFQKALYDQFIHTKPTLDEERLLVKIRTGFGRLNVRTDYKTYRHILSRLYNSRLKGDLQHMTEAEVEHKAAIVQ